MITTTAVGFAGQSAGSAPLTWAQRDIWERITYGELRPTGKPRTWTMMRSFALPQGCRVGECIDLLTASVARHEALRTVFPVGTDGMPRQEVRDRGTIDVVVLHTDTADAHAQADHLTRLVSQPDLDTTSGFPVRFGLLVTDGTATQVVVRMAKLAADGASMYFLGSQLRPRCAQDLHIGAAQHRQQAAFQTSPRGSSLSKAALAYWTDGLSSAPDIGWADRMGLRTLDSGSLGRLTSPASRLAAAVIARRFGIVASTVVLAAAAAALAHAIGASSYFLRLQVANRIGPAERVAVCRQKQAALLPVSIGDTRTFGDLLTVVWRASLRAYQHSRYDPEVLRAAKLVLGDGPLLNFNNRRYAGEPAADELAASPPRVADRLGETELDLIAFANHSPNPRLDLRIGSVRSASELLMEAQANFLSPDGLRSLLINIENLLCAAARDEGSPWRRTLTS